MINEVLRNLEERRSIRKYKDQPVEKEKIDAVIRAGLYAASGKASQDTVILCITQKELRDELAEDNRKIAGMPESMDPFYGAQVVLVVLADKSVPTYVYDGSLVLGNMMNAAASLGLGSCWIHRAKQEFEMDKYHKLLKTLDIKGDYEGIGHLILGYPAEENPRPAPRKEGRVYIIDK